MRILDPDDPFFRRPYRRWLTTAVPAAWALVEASRGDLLWAGIFLAAAAYAGWMLLLRGPRPAPAEPSAPAPEAAPPVAPGADTSAEADAPAAPDLPQEVGEPDERR